MIRKTLNGAALLGIAIVCSAVDCPPDEPPAPSADVVMVGTTFNPSSLTIAAGDTVTWLHDAGVLPHTVTSGEVGAADAGSLFDSRGGDPDARMADGDTFTHVFTDAGTFDYHCVVHGGIGMVGTIIVQ